MQEGTSGAPAVVGVSSAVRAAVQSVPPIWLRDNCWCGDCRDAPSGQKLFGILDLSASPSIESLAEAGDDVIVVLAPDGHAARFPRAWLLESAGSGPGSTKAADAADERECWLARDLQGREPVFDWPDYVGRDDVKVEALRCVARLGFALLRCTPATEGTVLQVAASFGYVRETNYGRLFDVRAVVNPTNLAYTGLAIAPHTDNPYRDPVPTLQLLHCVSNAVEGGESGLVDGFRAAALLRAEDSESFDILTTTAVPFAWSDGRHVLRAERPLVEEDRRGELRAVRFNNRSMQALRLPKDELLSFYGAYRSFAEIVSRPELAFGFRLEEGDCVIFDNLRLLHSRTAFEDGASGSRHLQGCYADMDGLRSTLAVLSGEGPVGR